jgi:hypothetical protein
LEIFLAYLIGKTYVGMRTEDVQSWTRILRDWAPEGRKPTEVHLVAVGEAAIPALHAAAFENDVYRSVTLRKMIPSWEHIVRASETFDQWVNVVHGALQHYDLPDLIELAGSGRVKLLDPADVLGRPIGPDRSGEGQECQREALLEPPLCRVVQSLNQGLYSGHVSTLMCHADHIAWRAGKRLRLDAQTESFDDPAASQFLGREHRKGYELPKIG